MASLPSKVDRQTTTPFLLKLFYKEGSFTPLSDFHPSSSSLPPHIALYTWQTCTLHELAHLLSHSHPQLLPTPSIGTRLAFRLIFPDTRSAGAGGASSLSANNNAPLGRFLHQDLGSVVLGVDGEGVGTVDAGDEEDGKAAAVGAAGQGIRRGSAEQAAVMLKDVRFVIGDYIAVAILPPLGNGNVAPMPGPAGQNVGMGGVARGGRTVEVGRDHHQQQGFGGGDVKRGGGGGRDNGYGGFRGRGGRGGGGWGGGPGSGGPRGVSLPSGEWRRGERLPDGPPGGGSRGGFGGGRGRDRW